MNTGLDEILERLGVGDAAFAEECHLLRGQIWAYRKGRKVPGSENAAAILAALKKRGVEVELKDLICPRKRAGRRTRAA